MNQSIKKVFVFFILLFTLITASIISLFWGGSDLNIMNVLNSLVSPFSDSPMSIIIWRIRIPRILLAIIVGYGLASTGAGFQGILRNSLADPYTLGISGGASFGATLGILLEIPFYFMPLFAFAGALLPVIFTLIISERRQFTSSSLILTGVIMSFMFSSIVMLLFSFSTSSELHQAVFFLMGDLTTVRRYELVTTLGVVLVFSVVLMIFGRDLDALSLGEEKAHYLGLNVANSRKLVFIAGSLIVASCVSAGGIIGFVGLMAPHFVRKFGIVNHRILMPLSGISGAILLIVSDAVARTIARPVEIPVGVITGIFGAVFFMIFFFRGKEWKLF